MRWEEMTSERFKAVMKETQVCIIALGVIERHGNHLPLGTDVINAHEVACRAAEKEPAVVFPQFIFGQINEARCFPGTIAIKPTLLFELLEAVTDEIGRNGFKKIIMMNGHGGSTDFLKFFNQCSLWREKPYSIYLYQQDHQLESKGIITDNSGHAGEQETSVTLVTAPQLVKMDKIPEESVESLKRMKNMPNTFTGILWYSNYPEHYSGNANLATVEKGKEIMKRQVDNLANYIAGVKADKVVPSLYTEFFERAGRINE